MPKARIVYATDILPVNDIRARMPRMQQSAAASRLAARLEEACPAAMARSRSHSRAIIAAAAGSMPGLILGIDVEWMAPNRPFDAITRMLLPSASLQMDMQTFYRGWTFSEAYYKAFGDFPGEALLREAIAAGNDSRAVGLADGTHVLLDRVAEDFRICLVWRHTGSEPEIIRVF
jgi:hypothetical protein